MFGGKLVPFKEAQPTIKAITVKVRQSGRYPMEPDARNDAYTIENPPGEYLSCGNSRCTGRSSDTGRGFAIGKHVFVMSATRETHREGDERCEGTEGRHRRSERCTFHWYYSIDIQYHPLPAKGAAPAPSEGN